MNSRDRMDKPFGASQSSEASKKDKAKKTSSNNAASKSQPNQTTKSTEKITDKKKPQAPKATSEAPPKKKKSMFEYLQTMSAQDVKKPSETYRELVAKEHMPDALKKFERMYNPEKVTDFKKIENIAKKKCIENEKGKEKKNLSSNDWVNVLRQAASSDDEKDVDATVIVLCLLKVLNMDPIHIFEIKNGVPTSHPTLFPWVACYKQFGAPWNSNCKRTKLFVESKEDPTWNNEHALEAFGIKKGDPHRDVVLKIQNKEIQPPTKLHFAKDQGQIAGLNSKKEFSDLLKTESVKPVIENLKQKSEGNKKTPTIQQVVETIFEVSTDDECTIHMLGLVNIAVTLSKTNPKNIDLDWKRDNSMQTVLWIASCISMGAKWNSASLLIRNVMKTPLKPKTASKNDDAASQDSSVTTDASENNQKQPKENTQESSEPMQEDEVKQSKKTKRDKSNLERSSDDVETGEKESNTASIDKPGNDINNGASTMETNKGKQDQSWSSDAQ